MNHQLNDLYVRRGRLLERIATQRVDLSREAQPVRAVLGTADHLLGYARVAANYVLQHPGIAALALAALFITKPRRVWRWTKRAFFAWQTWRTVRTRLRASGLRAGS